MIRKTISIDFDGVIHTDTRFRAPSIIEGAVNPEALRFMSAAVDTGWDVVVHSCRFYDLGAVMAVQLWIADKLIEHLGPVSGRSVAAHLQYSLTKPRARIYIDDRGFRYEGRFPQLEDIA